MRIRIHKQSGRVEWLGDIEFALPVGPVIRRRFSEIVPANRALLWLFRAIRKRFGDDGKMAAFTRQWPCLWRMEILMGPSKGFVQFGRNRSELIEVEKSIWFRPKVDL